MKIIIYILYLKLLLCNFYENNTKTYINNNTAGNVTLDLNLKSDKTILKKKNLILSTIIRFSWDKILPCIKSIIKINNRNFDIVIFIREVSQRVKDNLKSFGVIIYEIQTKLKSTNHIFRQRWKLYSDFLNNNKDNYNLVLSIDLRDTIMQSEFFSLYDNYTNFLGFSYESANIDKLIEKNYIIDTFGYDIYKSIENKRTINCGTVWGTLDYFLKFSNIAYNKLLKYFTVDQTIINYLIYYENILNNWTVIFSDEYDKVITLGLTGRNKIKLDQQKNILNFKGEIASIVHQYDRYRDIKKIIRNKFCPELKDIKSINNLFFMHELLIIILFFKMMFSCYNIKSAKNSITK